MLGDHGSRFLRRGWRGWPVEHRLVVEREGALFACDRGRCAIGFAFDQLEPAAGQRDRRRAAISRAAEQQGVGEARDAKPDATLGLGFAFLFRERVARNVDDIVEQANRGAGQLGEQWLVERRIGLEGIDDEAGEVDRTQQACAVGRKHLLAARIAGADLFAMREIVEMVDPVDEDHASSAMS